ncbi:MAG: hypothetical protein RIT02_988, partial [Planctomycetota bacterium]
RQQIIHVVTSLSDAKWKRPSEASLQRNVVPTGRCSPPQHEHCRDRTDLQNPQIQHIHDLKMVTPTTAANPDPVFAQHHNHSEILSKSRGPAETKPSFTNALQCRGAHTMKRQDPRTNPDNRRQPNYKNETDFFQKQGRVEFRQHSQRQPARNSEHSVNSYDRNCEYSIPSHAAPRQRHTPAIPQSSELQ